MNNNFLIEIMIKKILKEKGIKTSLLPWDEEMFKELGDRIPKSNQELSSIKEFLKEKYKSKQDTEKRFINEILGFNAEKFKNIDKNIETEKLGYDVKNLEIYINEFYLLINSLRKNDEISLYRTTKRINPTSAIKQNSLLYNKFNQKRVKPASANEKNDLSYSKSDEKRINVSLFTDLINQYIVGEQCYIGDKELIETTLLSRYEFLGTFINQLLQNKITYKEINKYFFDAINNIGEDMLNIEGLNIHFLGRCFIYIDSLLNILFLNRSQNTLNSLKEIIKKNIDYLKIKKEDSYITLNEDWGYFLFGAKKLSTETLTPTDNFLRNKERTEQNKKFNYEEYYNLSKNKELFEKKHKDLEEEFLISVADKKLFIKHLAYRFIFFLELKELQNNYDVSISVIKKLSKYETKEKIKNRIKSLSNKYGFEKISKEDFNEYNVIERNICKDDIKNVFIRGNGVELPEYIDNYYLLNDNYKRKMKDYDKIVEYTYLNFKLYYLEAGLDINEIIIIKNLFNDYISILLEKNLTPRDTIQCLYKFFKSIKPISIKYNK